MRKIVIGNWKMYAGPAANARALAQSLTSQCAALPPEATVVVCPPSLFLAAVAETLAPTVHLGGQDCFDQPVDQGAFTGDISALMLKAAGARYVLVGHSERRHFHSESNFLVKRKAEAAISAGLIPVICIGEQLAQREAGSAEATVGQQVKESLPETATLGNFMLAYEPVWAIGSGLTPTLIDIQQMHTHIRQVVSQTIGLRPEALHVLYGGSVKAANAAEIMSLESVSGVLVGGASLNAEEFGRIIAAAQKE